MAVAERVQLTGINLILVGAVVGAALDLTVAAAALVSPETTVTGAPVVGVLLHPVAVGVVHMGEAPAGREVGAVRRAVTEAPTTEGRAPAVRQGTI